MTEEYDVDVLYKYRDISNANYRYVERIFTHNELYFSKPLDFNDPFDCQPRFSLEASTKEKRDYLKDRFPKIFPGLSRQQRRIQIKSLVKTNRLADPGLLKSLEGEHRKRILEETGVFCLSEIPDHILMWSHYSSSHTGICIEFEASSKTKFFSLAQRVHYQKDYPVLNVIKDSPDEILEKALLTKAKFWEYEKEWRISWQDNPPGVYRFPNGLLKGVIFGSRINEQDKEMVKSWISKMDYNPSLYQAKLKKYEYGLDIDQIE